MISPSVTLSDTKKVRQKDIAERLGVSISTVSLALNHSDRVAPETRRQVIETAKLLGYDPPVSESMQDQRVTSLVITYAVRQIPQFDPFYHDVLCGAETASAELGAELRYTQIGSDETRLADIARDAQAMLLVGTIPEAKVRTLMSGGFPIVLVDNDLPYLQLDRVLTENAGSVYRMFNSLYDMGHRRIAFLRGPDSHPSLKSRHAGYRDACAAFGCDPIEYYEPLDQHDMPNAEAPFEQLFQPGWDDQFTAMLCFNDTVAISVMNDAQQRGIHVPDDLSIVGFDGVQLSRFTQPSLATSVVRRDLLGRFGVEQLRKRVLDPGAPPTAITIDTTWIPGDSISPPSR